jgi:hypothetical protein
MEIHTYLLLNSFGCVVSLNFHSNTSKSRPKGVSPCRCDSWKSCRSQHCIFGGMIALDMDFAVALFF